MCDSHAPKRGSKAFGGEVRDLQSGGQSHAADPTHAQGDSPIRRMGGCRLRSGLSTRLAQVLCRRHRLAVKGSRFVAVCRNEGIRPIAGANTTMIDAEGMTVTPGFIDAHSRPSGAGVDELLLVNVDLCSVRAIQSALQARVEATPLGEWVIGFKYDDTKLDEGRPINRLDLDEVAPDHPVELCQRGGHAAVYNSKAFQLAGITAQTPDQRGGRFYRESGELTGLVAD